MKVVICDHVFPGIGPEQEALSAVPGLELIDANELPLEEKIALCRDADGVMSQYTFMTEEVINTFEKCRVMATFSVGYDRIDTDAAARRGIYVTNSPDYNKSEVSDHICTMLLALSRHLFQFDRRIRRGLYVTPYDEIRPHRLDTQTVGFIGYGRIARLAAAKLHNAFGLRVLAYDPFLTEQQIAEAGGEKAELDTVMSQSDYVSVNVSLMPSTRNLIGRRELQLMKPTAYLINCSRGGLVEDSALIEALQTGAIAGAGIDTHAEEPLPADSPYCSMDNVILTPHVAWYNLEAMDEVQRVAGEQVAMVLNGQQPTRCVNFEKVQEYRKSLQF